MTWTNEIIIQNSSNFWKNKFGSKFYHQRDIHSSPDFILQLIIVIEMKWIMCLALKSILILALMTWTIEIITEKGSNFQKIKFGSILCSHRALRSASRRFSLEILKSVKFEMVLELFNSVIWTGNWILSGILLILILWSI